MTISKNEKKNKMVSFSNLRKWGNRYLNFSYLPDSNGSFVWEARILWIKIGYWRNLPKQYGCWNIKLGKDVLTFRLVKIPPNEKRDISYEEKGRLFEPKNICIQCRKENAPIRVEPTRHACSPNSINWLAKNEEEKFYLEFCSRECEKKYQDLSFAFWAELDRNTSDSECFEHISWEGKMRIGKCKINGAQVGVEPLQVGDNSGQPKECYDHFVLRKKYQDLINQHAQTS